MKQKLPNSTLILVFGILSLVLCCCYGIGIIFSIIVLVLTPKAIALYNEQPEIYTGYSNVAIGRILAIIGLVLNVAYLGWVIYLFATYGYEGILEMNEEIMREYGWE